ncbi:MAG: nitronate monooxygenase family protein [Actinomycetota bacterium]|nr:nitronate monooxygenase family protein [Actinomycetota bacterium]
MNNDITEMFGIDVPIFAFSHCRDVVVAVSKAGGMGVLGAASHSDRSLEIDLEWIEEELGDRPYGVDVIVPAKYEGSDEGGLTVADVMSAVPPEHRRYIDDILERYDVPALPDDEQVTERDEAAAPMSAGQAGPHLDIALAHNPAFLVNALGPPPQFMIEQCQEAGRKIGALAGKVQHAERHVNVGVDVVIAQGTEAGGHTGEIASMVLIPEIVDAIAPVPVLGAGGVGRGRQMAASMALGAQGVWCGSVWLTTEEAETHPVVKEKFLNASSSDTIRSRSRTGKPARQLKSAWTEEWENPATPMPLGMPAQPILTSDAIRRIDRAAYSTGSGAEALANYFVGQIVGTMNQSRSATQVVYDMIEEFIEATESLGAQLVG